MSYLWQPGRTLPKDHVDANEIVSYLWQGSQPPTGKTLQRAGFKYLVLSAWENQPSRRKFPGVKVLRVPLEDAPRWPSQQERRAIFSAAHWVTEKMEKGSVLVTCQAGLNRSGIISAMSLIIRGDSPQAAVMMVRMAREHALSNRHFREYLLSLG